MFWDMAFFAQCAPQVHPNTTAAIVRVESAGDPLAIYNNTLKRRLPAQTAAQARRIARQYLDQGHSLDLGLMQINSHWLPYYRLSLEQIFEPCVNVAVGGRILTDNYVRYVPKSKSKFEALLKALSAYNTGSPYKGKAYVAKVRFGPQVKLAGK